MKRHILLAATLALSPAAAFAQAPAPTPAPAPEPAPDRLAKAKEVMALIFPEGQREAMMRSMLNSMNGSLRAGLSQMLQGQQLTDAQRPILQAFVERQQKRSQEQVIAEMPALIDAIARAYARQFSMTELTDLAAFFKTPSGKAYIAKSMTMMGDPDVAAVQTRLMQNSMTGMQGDMKQLAADMKAAAAKTP